MKPWRRLVLLLACLAAGLGVGVWGSAWAGSAAWYLAIPIALGIGWLFVADPTQCLPPGRSDDTGPGRASDDATKT